MVRSKKKKISKKNNFNLHKFVYNNFKLTLKDLFKLKNYILFSFALFFIICLFGFFYPYFFEKEIFKLVKELIEMTLEMNSYELINFIMFNNIKTAFFAFVSGIFLGIIPFIILVINAYVIGFVGSKTVDIEGFLILWRLLPHGIFEIPAILISVSLGIKLGISLIVNCIIFYYKKIKKFNLVLLVLLSLILFFISFPIVFILTLMSNSLRKKFLEDVKTFLRIFILIVVPLLVIAGLIEGLLIVFVS